MWVNGLPGAPLLFVMPKKSQSSKIPAPDSSSAQTALAAGKGSCRPYSNCGEVAVLHWSSPLPQARVSVPGPQEAAL